MRLFIYIMILLSSAPLLFADDFIKDPEPVILEVHYSRPAVNDTTMRETRFRKDPVMLRIGKTKSLFCGSQNLWKDSIMTVDPAAFFAIDRARIEKDPTGSEILGGYYWDYIYKNYPEGKLTLTSYFDMEDWRYEEDWEKPEWEIGDSTRTILGYECIQAFSYFRGRRWIAWFTPEIPIQEGPWKLCGLPGLILEAYDANMDYSFTPTAIVANTGSMVGFHTYRERRGVTKVSREKFLNNWWRYKHSDSGAKIRAAYGHGPEVSATKRTVNYDNEETDYPHDL